MYPASRRPDTSNRTVFVVIVALAATLILCSLFTRTVGWMRLCGGGLILTGAFFLLLAERKGWPAAILLAGLALFFWDTLIALTGGG